MINAFKYFKGYHVKNDKEDKSRKNAIEDKSRKNVWKVQLKIFV